MPKHVGYFLLAFSNLLSTLSTHPVFPNTEVCGLQQVPLSTDFQLDLATGKHRQENRRKRERDGVFISSASSLPGHPLLTPATAPGRQPSLPTTALSESWHLLPPWPFLAWLK